AQPCARSVVRSCEMPDGASTADTPSRRRRVRTTTRAATGSGGSSRAVVGIEGLQCVLLDGGVGLETVFGALITAERRTIPAVRPVAARVVLRLRRHACGIRVFLGVVRQSAAIVRLSAALGILTRSVRMLTGVLRVDRKSTRLNSSH